jgi:hypothetical protein
MSLGNCHLLSRSRAVCIKKKENIRTTKSGEKTEIWNFQYNRQKHARTVRNRQTQKEHVITYCTPTQTNIFIFAKTNLTQLDIDILTY